MAVSHYLAGNRAAPRQLRSVLVALVGVHAAGLIIDAIPERKAAP